MVRPSFGVTELSYTPPSFELQAHSTHSDGELSPAETVRAASRAGVELLALSDHDSVAGLNDAAVAAAEVGVGLVPGVEISIHDPIASDLHVCGYLIDPGDPELDAALARSRGDRERRAQRMVEALEGCGWAIDSIALARRQAAGATLGRPHLAQAVLSHPDNAERLARERLTGPSDFLEAYLIEGKPAFSKRDAPSIDETVALIHQAGGLAVWAHPFWDMANDAEVVTTLERFTSLGLNGVEAFYPTHTRAQTDLLARRASELGLLTTGSSDFHGPHHQQFNRFRNFQTYGHQPNLGPLLGS